MKKGDISYFLPIVFLLLFVSGQSCSKSEDDNKIITQESNIDSYIQKITERDTIYYGDGYYRIVLQKGVGETLEKGDSVYFQYAGYTFDSSNGRGALIDTNVDTLATLAGLDISLHKNFGCGVIGKGEFIKGLDKGMIGMQAGEFSAIIFTSENGYPKKRNSLVLEMTPLYFDILIEKIVKK